MRKYHHKEWRVRGSLLPGQKGTLKPYEEYGDRLVCVRYRYNAERNRRIKTVEIVIDEAPWRTEVSEAQKKEIATAKMTELTEIKK